MREDPVRMLRAVALASRLDFTVESALTDAIRRHRREIARSSAPRLLEELYKILRAGSSEKTFRWLQDVGLLEAIAPELHRGAAEALWRSLAALDTYRRQFASMPESLTNAILLGTLLAPLGPLAGPGRPVPTAPDGANRAPGPRLGELPLARRDVERLRQILTLQRRLRDTGASPRARRALAHRSIFPEALTWLEIHGGAPELVAEWRTLRSESPEQPPALPGEPPPLRRRRRRRRRRFRPTPEQ
jgi:poly(A) polymerase